MRERENSEEDREGGECVVLLVVKQEIQAIFEIALILIRARVNLESISMKVIHEMYSISGSRSMFS